MYKYKVNGRQYTSQKKVLNGSEILGSAELSPADDYELLQKLAGKEFEFVRPDEEVDLSLAGLEKFRARHKKEVEYSVNGEVQSTTECDLTVTEILEAAGFNNETHFLKEVRGNAEISYEDDPEVSIRIRNKMQFLACKRELVLIVNGTPKPWDKAKISFKEVIILAYGTFIDRPTMVYTVAYEDGPVQNPEGSMLNGSVVCVQNKMIFHATATDKS